MKALYLFTHCELAELCKLILLFIDTAIFIFQIQKKKPLWSIDSQEKDKDFLFLYMGEDV